MINAQDLTKSIQEAVGKDWEISLTHLQDKAGFGLHLSSELSYMAMNDSPYEAVAKRLGQLKLVSEVINENVTLKDQNKKMLEELELYRSIIPNLSASLTGGEH